MHPVILHPDHHFTKLIVSAEHIRLHHAGPQLLIVSLHQKYWIPRIMNVVKAIIYQCLPCYRFKVQFVCFVTKAIHLEVVISLTTEAFLAALRRFSARRGRPRTIHSDNGTNYRGASNQMHHIYTMLQSSSQMATTQDFLSKEG
jgi:hypothetical protein